MENEARKINVRIGGMSYNLVSGESEQYTRQIAARADEMIRRVIMQSPHLSQQMTTILALVNAVDELSRQAAQLGLAEQQREATELKNAELRVELAKLREVNWEMKKEILRLNGLVREQAHTAASAATATAHAAAPIAAKSNKTEPFWTEPALVEPVQPEPVQPEPVQPEPVQPEPVQPEPAQLETTQSESANAEPAPFEPAMPEPVISAEPPVAKPARVLPPLGINRNQMNRAKPAESTLKSWRTNPWADAGEPEPAHADLPGTLTGNLPAEGLDAAADTTVSPPAWEPSSSATASVATAANPFETPAAAAGAAQATAKTPRLLHEMRQTGLEEYLSHVGQGRSVVTDLRQEDEP